MPTSPDLKPPFDRPSFRAAQQSAFAPALALMITSSLWMAILTAGIIAAAAQWSDSQANEADRRLPALLRKSTQAQGRILLSIALLAEHSFVIYGALCMMRLRGYAVTSAAAILATLPCCASGYAFGIPFGLWAILVLHRPEVKYEFRPYFDA